VDISTRMLARLRAQVSVGSAPIGVVLGDATRLPLATASVRAALIVHVIHLVSDWRATLSEVHRVVMPGGVLIHDATHYSQNNPWQEVFAKRTELLRELGFVPRGRPSDDEIAAYITSLGATQRRVTYAERDEQEVAREVIDRARRRVDSWTWEIPDAIFPAFFTRYEQHASSVLGGLDATNVTHVAYGMDVWTFA
jgi:SAM-dependent methyltransferase